MEGERKQVIPVILFEVIFFYFKDEQERVENFYNFLGFWRKRLLQLILFELEKFFINGSSPSLYPYLCLKEQSRTKIHLSNSILLTKRSFAKELIQQLHALNGIYTFMTHLSILVSEFHNNNINNH